MPDGRSIPSCSHCGERVGVYERLWFERGDGEVLPSSILNMRRDGVDPLGVALWHPQCLAAMRTSSS
jgi:hypothetical protein